MAKPQIMFWLAVAAWPTILIGEQIFFGHGALPIAATVVGGAGAVAMDYRRFRKDGRPCLSSFKDALPVAYVPLGVMCVADLLNAVVAMALVVGLGTFGYMLASRIQRSGGMRAG